jgi:hypothetical protein
LGAQGSIGLVLAWETPGFVLVLCGLTDVRLAASLRAVPVFLRQPPKEPSRSHVAREDEDLGAVSQDACQSCGTTDELIRDRDIEGLFLCRSCKDAIARQQQFIDWGFGEAPDDLG